MLDITVRVTGFENSGATVYKTDVHIDGHTWRVDIRYSTFREFYLKLHALYKDVDFAFPYKRGWLTSHPPQERQVQLDNFMQKTIRYYVRHGYPKTVEELLEQLLEVSQHVKKTRNGRHSETMESNLSEEHVISMSTVNVVKELEHEAAEEYGEPEEEMSEGSQDSEVHESLEQSKHKPESKKPVEQVKIKENDASEDIQKNERQREESDASTVDVEEEAVSVHSPETPIQDKEFLEKATVIPTSGKEMVQSVELASVTPDTEVKVQEIVVVSSSVSGEEITASHHQTADEANEIDTLAEKTGLNSSPILVSAFDDKDRNAAESAIDEVDTTSLSTNQNLSTDQYDKESTKSISKEIEQNAVVAAVEDAEKKVEDKTSHSTVDEEEVVDASAPVLEGSVILNSPSTSGSDDKGTIVCAIDDNEMDVTTPVLNAKEREDMNSDVASTSPSVVKEQVTYVSGAVDNNVDPVVHQSEDGVAVARREHEEAAHPVFVQHGEIAPVPTLNEEIEEHDDLVIVTGSVDEDAAKKIPNGQAAITLNPAIAVETSTSAVSVQKISNLENAFHKVLDVEQIVEMVETATSTDDFDEKPATYEHSVVVTLVDESVGTTGIEEEENDVAVEVKCAQSVAPTLSDKVNITTADEIASDQGNHDHGEDEDGSETIDLKRAGEVVEDNIAEAKQLSSVIGEAQQNDALVATDFSSVNDKGDHLKEASANVYIARSVHQEVADASLPLVTPKDEEAVGPAALNELSEKLHGSGARDTSSVVAVDNKMISASSESSTKMHGGLTILTPLFKDETTATAAVNLDCEDRQITHPSVESTGLICDNDATEKASENPSAVVVDEDVSALDVAADEDEREKSVITPNTDMEVEETIVRDAVYTVDDECSIPSVQVVNENVDLSSQHQMEQTTSADADSFAASRDEIVTASTIPSETRMEETGVRIQAVSVGDKIEALKSLKEFDNHVIGGCENTSDGSVAVAEMIEKKDVIDVCSVDSISTGSAEKEARRIDTVSICEKMSEAKATAADTVAIVDDSSNLLDDDLPKENVDASSPVAIVAKKLTGDRSPIAIVKSKLLGENNSKVYWVGLAVGVAAVGALAARKS